MNQEILIRLAISVCLALAGYAFYHLGSRLILKHAASATRPAMQTNAISLLYFTTPDCAPCRSIQRPAIMKVKESLGNRVNVVEINAYEQPELTRQWGVLSVPTTFILNPDGKPLHVNHGVTSATKLLQQIEKITA